MLESEIQVLLLKMKGGAPIMGLTQKQKKQEEKRRARNQTSKGKLEVYKKNSDAKKIKIKK